MRLVVDSNIIFAAIIKDSTTRRLLLTLDDELFFPAIILDEFEKHKNELARKSGLNTEEAERLLHRLTARMVLIKTEELLSYREQAIAIIREIDIDDTLFIACALANP
jgi:predicted nucleic acid-binding protein